MIRFDAPVGDSRKIAQIADRALRKRLGISYTKTDIMMDLTACHLNGCELDLEQLLASGDGDFAHDVFGIRRFLDRTRGTLTECFLPRCAKPEGKP